MQAILGSTPEAVNAVIVEWQARGVIANANDNAPGQIVVSGDVETLQAAAPDFKAPAPGSSTCRSAARSTRR